VTATILDGRGDAVAGVFCTFSILSQPGTDAGLDTVLMTTKSNGQATTTLHAGSEAGTIEVQARCGAVIVSAGVQVTAAPPASLPDTGTGLLPAGTPGGDALLLALLGFLIALAGVGAVVAAGRMRQAP
jgi:hypothetical protein